MEGEGGDGRDGLTVSTFAHSEIPGLRRFISLSDDRRRQCFLCLLKSYAFNNALEKEEQEMSLKRATIALATVFGLALVACVLPEPAAAFTSAQRAACGGDAQRLCSSSMSDPQKLNACMQSNQSKVSSGCRAAMGGGKKKENWLNARMKEPVGLIGRRVVVATVAEPRPLNGVHFVEYDVSII